MTAKGRTEPLSRWKYTDVMTDLDTQNHFAPRSPRGGRGLSGDRGHICAGLRDLWTHAS